MKGTVQWFNARKGFGFIQGEDGKDVFVHQTALPMGVFLNEGDQVEFEKEDSNRGPRAVNVRKL
ncbi:MAG: cold shock domain-containing protein [Theionarchaea archaeon]|nr:cold shock domain-containing protein [Theionarchaea archaeon]